jgi:hypothetical protein
MDASALPDPLHIRIEPCHFEITEVDQLVTGLQAISLEQIGQGNLIGAVSGSSFFWGSCAVWVASFISVGRMPTTRGDYSNG